MEVLLEGLTKLEVDMTDIYAMELIGANNLPKFSDLVFTGIQEASQGKDNQSVPDSATIPNNMWRLA